MEITNKTMSNMFALLEDKEEEIYVKPTSDFARKAKKKMREIEILKEKTYITDEEKCKIQQETFWKTFTPSNKKLEKYNRNEISSSLRQCCIQKDEDCPICINRIPKSMGVVTNCNHSYCRVCISKLINTSNFCIYCSLCRTEITNLDFQNKDYMFETMDILSKKIVRVSRAEYLELMEYMRDQEV